MMENEKITLEKGLQREWIITNGIGGLAMFYNSWSKY